MKKAPYLLLCPYVETDHEIFSMIILSILLIQKGQLFLAKEWPDLYAYVKTRLADLLKAITIYIKHYAGFQPWSKYCIYPKYSDRYA